MTAVVATVAGPSATLAEVEDLRRQAAHWSSAARTLLDPREFAPAQAWATLEDQTGIPLRRRLGDAVSALIASASRTEELVRRAGADRAELTRARRAVQVLRLRYAQVETTLDFFGDAVSSRTSDGLSAALGLLDRLAARSMRPPLEEAGIPVPPALTYVKPGMGASILRAGIRLWSPGTVNPVAAIKVVRHNLYRPTSLFHETGHQVAHLTGWVASMRSVLEGTLRDDRQLERMWTPWVSEIAADVFAFLHTGYASVTALYDVVGDARTVLRWPIGDPHPVGWVRARLGCALARQVYGDGPWDRLDSAIVAAHPLERAAPGVAPLLERSSRRLADLAEALLDSGVPALGGRPMAAVVDPDRVSPAALRRLQDQAGPSAWTSPAWRDSEGIRLIALAGLREAERPESAHEWTDRARSWMTQTAPAA